MRPLAAVEDHAPSSGGIVAARGTPATGNQHCWQWSWPLVPGPRQSPFCRAFQCILPLARSSFVIRELLAQLLEPPCTDPYARWCGRGRQATAAPMPILRANRTELQGWTSDHGLVARRPQTMKQRPRSRVNRKKARTVLRLPDLEHAKAAVLNSLTSADAQRGYRHAIKAFVDWYCSEPRLAFNRTVVLRYRSHLESRQLYLLPTTPTMPNRLRAPPLTTLSLRWNSALSGIRHSGADHAALIWLCQR